MRTARLLPATVIASGVVALVVSAAPLAQAAPAAQATCNVMTLQTTSQGGLVLEPGSLTVDAGTCVAFANDSNFAAQFSVNGYQQTVPPGMASTTDYVAEPAGTTQGVTATEVLGRASGTIVIKPAPAPSSPSTPAPHPSATQPPPHPTSPPPAPTPGATSIAPTHTPSPPTSPSARPPRPTPSRSGAPFLSGQTTPTPSPSPGTVVAGPLQPPTGRGTGLPAALAALAIVATAAALLRVLLAEPVAAVDDRRAVSA